MAQISTDFIFSSNLSSVLKDVSTGSTVFNNLDRSISNVASSGGTLSSNLSNLSKVLGTFDSSSLKKSLEPMMSTSLIDNITKGASSFSTMETRIQKISGSASTTSKSLGDVINDDRINKTRMYAEMFDLLDSGIRNPKTNVDNLSTSFSNLGSQLKYVDKDMSNIGAVAKPSADALANLDTYTTRTVVGMEKASAASSIFNKAVGLMGVPADYVQGSIKNLGDAIELKLISGMSTASGKISDFGSRLKNEVKAGAGIAQDGISTFIGKLGNLKDAVEGKAISGIDNLKNAFGNIKTSVSNGVSALGNFVSDGLSNLGSFITGTALPVLGELAIKLGTAIVNSVKDGVTAISEFSLQMERDTMIWGNVLDGSGENVDDFMDKIKQVAKDTPYDIGQVSESWRKMHAAGVPLEDLPATFETLGNASVATGSDLSRFTKVFTDMTSAQKINAQDMRQLTEAGVPAWDLLAEAINDGSVKMTDGMKQFGEAGKITAGDVREMSKASELGADAVDGLWSAINTKYSGNMDAILQTTPGQIDRLKDSALSGFLPVGDALMSGFFEPLKAVNNLFDDVDATSAKAFQDMGVNVQEGQSVMDYFAQSVGSSLESLIKPLGSLVAEILPPIIVKIGQFAEVLVQGLASSAPGIQGLVTGLAAVASVVLDVLIAAFQTLNPILSFVVNLLKPIGTALQVIGEIVAAILIPIFKALQPAMEDTFSGGASFADMLSKVIRTIGDIILSVVVPAITGLAPIISAVFGLAATIIKTVIGIVTALGNFLSSVLGPVLKGIGTTGGTAFQLISTVVGKVLGAVSSLVSTIVGALAGAFSILKSKAQPVLDVIKGAVDKVAGAFNGVIGAVKGVVDWISRIKFPSPPGWLSKLMGGGGNANPSLGDLGVSAPQSASIQSASIQGASLIPTNSISGLQPQMATAGNNITINAQYIDENYFNTLMVRANRKGGF